MRPGFSDPTVERFHAYLSERHDERTAVGAFDAFFSAAAAGLLLADENLRFLQVNKKLASLTGLSVDDHRGRTFDDVLPRALEPTLRAVLHSGEAVDKVPFEVCGRSFLGTFFPVYAEDRRVAGLGGILIDITEHKRLERELRSAIEIRERVLAVVSHDLRNPLGTIQLAMATMPESVRCDPEARRRIDIVERATKTMETLICDLLDMATIQTGKLTLHVADEEVGAIVQEAVDLEAPLAAERGLVLEADLQVAGVHLRCDRARLMQVLGNLCGNAIKFCNPGDHVRVSARVAERTLLLEIADTGPGIPADDIPHLFEPYWSTARGRQRGTGLGLYISNTIVEAHGGTIAVDSTVGHGTTFRILLPLG